MYSCISGTYQFGDKRYRLPPGSNVWHAVDIAVERVVSRMPATKTRQGISVLLAERNKQIVLRALKGLWRRRVTEMTHRTSPIVLLLTKNMTNFNACITSNFIPI